MTTEDRATTLTRFIDHYVDRERSDAFRLDAFVRTYVTQNPAPDDAASLAELRFDGAATGPLTLYLRAKTHESAMLAITDEGALVLGLSLDDPDDSPETLQAGAELISELMGEFGASAGIAGVEMPPPDTAAEWRSDALVPVRRGTV